MTSIFDKYSDLDPVRMRKQVETAHGSPVFDQYSHDPVRAEAQMRVALSVSFDRFALLDPEREQAAIDAALSGGGGIPDWLPPNAIGFLDFKNGHYWNGSSVVGVNDVLADDQVNLYFLMPSQIQAGVGYVGNGTDPVGGAIIDPLKTAILGGCTVVIDFVSTDAATGGVFNFDVFDSPDFNGIWSCLSDNAILQSLANGLSGSAGGVGVGVNKAAATFKFDTPKVSISLNGGSVVVNSGGSEPVPFNWVAFEMTNVGSDKSIIRSITIYEVQSDVDLPTLSVQ